MPEPEVTPTETVEDTVVTPDGEQKPPEKTFTQSEVNRLMAKERQSATKKYDTLKSEYDTLKKSVEDKEAEAEEAAKSKVAELRKDLPENITKLLDKLSAVEQLEWLSDPANQPKRTRIPPLPDAHPEQRGPGLKVPQI